MKLEEKSKDELVEQIRRMQDRAQLRQEAWLARENFFIKKLGTARNAKTLANQRADLAEKAMREMQANLRDALKIGEDYD